MGRATLTHYFFKIDKTTERFRAINNPEPFGKPVFFNETAVTDHVEELERLINAEYEKTLKKHKTPVPRFADGVVLTYERRGSTVIASYYGIAFCSRREWFDNIRLDGKWARKRAIANFIRGEENGWKLAIEEGLIKGHVPANKEEVLSRRLARRESRRQTALNTRVKKLREFLPTIGMDPVVADVLLHQEKTVQKSG